MSNPQYKKNVDRLADELKTYNPQELCLKFVNQLTAQPKGQLTALDSLEGVLAQQNRSMHQ